MSDDASGSSQLCCCDAAGYCLLRCVTTMCRARRGGAAYHVRSAQIQLRLMIHRASRSMPNSQEYNILNSEEERSVRDTQRTFSMYIIGNLETMHDLYLPTL